MKHNARQLLVNPEPAGPTCGRCPTQRLRATWNPQNRFNSPLSERSQAEITGRNPTIHWLVSMRPAVAGINAARDTITSNVSPELGKSMGSCCFTPTKRDFLWWYWLFLVSIVGIPMLLAVWYVSRGANADEEEKRRRGKAAACIFWLGTFIVGVCTFVGVRIALDVTAPDRDVAVWNKPAEFADYVTLALQFLITTVAANATNSLVRKYPLFARIPLMLLCLGAFLVTVTLLDAHFQRPAVNLMQFLVCMLPAHYWGVFKDRPDARQAWKAFWAFMAAAAMFFVVAHGGEPLVQLILGRRSAI